MTNDETRITNVETQSELPNSFVILLRSSFVFRHLCFIIFYLAVRIHRGPEGLLIFGPQFLYR